MIIPVFIKLIILTIDNKNIKLYIKKIDLN